MPHLSSSLRTAFTLVAITGLTATTQAASAAPGKGHGKRVQTGRQADLVVRDLDVQIGDDSMEVGGTVKNIGFKKATRSDVIVAISSDATLDDADEVIGDQSIRKVRPGKSRDVDFDLDIPSDDDLPSGTVYLLVCADGNNAVAERSETNNCQSSVLADAADDSTTTDDSTADDSTSADDGTSSDDPSADQASVDVFDPSQG